MIAPNIMELIQTSCNYSLNMRSSLWLVRLLGKDFVFAGVIILERRL